jgi:endonuclease IV
MLITTNELVDIIGHNQRWFSNKFRSSKYDAVRNGRSIYDTKLMEAEANYLMSICCTKNNTQRAKSIKMLQQVVKYCKGLE